MLTLTTPVEQTTLRTRPVAPRRPPAGALRVAESRHSRRGLHRGATLVEFVVIAPTLLLMTLAMLQTGLVFHAKSSLNYAVFEAARAGATNNARPQNIIAAFTRAMVPYYGGGRTAAELARSTARARADLAAAVRVEILSPTVESFEDYGSPRASRALGSSARVIPNANLPFLACPADRPHCNADPDSNRSGQTLADANLLKLRVTWGIPATKQVPLAGRFFTWAVSVMNPADPDPFRRALLTDGRIPVVSHTTVRMQSPAIENDLMASIPGPGNHGTPEDPGSSPEQPALPECSFIDPFCLNPLPASGESDTGSESDDTGSGGGTELCT